MSTRITCDACGGTNGATAAFCGQCFAPLAASGAPAAAPLGMGMRASGGTAAYAPGLGLGSPAPPPPSTHARPRASSGTQVSGGVKFLVFLVVAAAVFFGTKFFLLDKGTTFTAEDGAYEFTYSDYWKVAEETPAFASQGIEIDTMIESDSAVVTVISGPAPPGDLSQLDGSLFEQGFESAPLSPQLEDWSVPGERDIGGERAIFEGKGYVEILGVRGDVDMVMGLTPGADRQMVLFEHACISDQCNESTPEFEAILDSVSFDG